MADIDASGMSIPGDIRKEPNQLLNADKRYDQQRFMEEENDLNSNKKRGTGTDEDQFFKK